MILFTRRSNPEKATREDFSQLASKVLISSTWTRRAPTNEPQPSFEDDFWEQNFEGLEVRRLVDILPASVEHSEVIGRLIERDVERMFSGLLELKTQRVPRLQRIHLARNGRLSPSTRVLCAMVGMTLSCD